MLLKTLHLKVFEKIVAYPLEVIPKISGINKNFKIYFLIFTINVIEKSDFYHHIYLS